MLHPVCPQGALLPLRAEDWTGGGSSSVGTGAGREAELKYLHRGEMTHGDLMSQAEDVADQVSSSARGTRTQNRPHRAETRPEGGGLPLVDRCRVAVDPADRSSEPHFVLMKFGEVYSAAADDWFSSVPGLRT